MSEHLDRLASQDDDLVGHVLAQEPWELVCFPAIAEADEVHEIETILGPRRFTRRRGEALPNTISPANISNPRPRSAAAWFKRYSAKDQPERFEQIG